jgi:two-component system, NarL family, invasion response regulator UvrY
MMTKKVKVLLVDDHAVVRAGFKMLLTTGHAIEIVAEAERGEQVVHLYAQKAIDVVVMDLSMPGIGGLEAIRRLLLRFPEAKVLVFSVHHEQVYINRALNAGARGYITKNSAPDILPAAIATIMAGEQYVENGLLQQSDSLDFQAVINAFSQREFDVFRRLAVGVHSQTIADELCLSYKTVSNYATQIKKKLGARSTAELLQIAQLSGVASIPDLPKL